MPKLPPQHGAARKKERSGRGRLAAAILAVCLLIGGYFVLREFLIFTPEGIRLSLPWREEETAESPGSGTVVRPLSEQLPPVPEKSVSIDRGELPPVTRGHLRGPALYVAGRSREELLDDAKALKAAGYTAAAVQVKPPDAPAVTAEELRMAAEVCAETRLRFIAYLSCFRDDTAARTRPELALTDKNGDLFIDYHYSAWLDPANPEVQARVLELASLSEACGAELVLLNTLCYPGEGNVDIFEYGRNAPVPTEVISEFARTLGDALTVPAGAVLIGDDTLGEGASERRGQDAAVLADCFDSLWTEAADVRAAREQRRRVLELAETEYGACVDGVWMESVWLDG